MHRYFHWLYYPTDCPYGGGGQPWGREEGQSFGKTGGKERNRLHAGCAKHQNDRSCHRCKCQC